MLTIGSLKLDFPVLQAALSGYSDLAMRRVARRHGAEYTLNEVVLDQLVIMPGKKQRQIARVEDGDHPVGGQLMGVALYTALHLYSHDIDNRRHRI